ncbi:dihydrofolate reductase [Paramagnetospirillum marisnigri]|uniref:Dihydrofolate reductase n=1 Tax=Paramagnetospirillum marisnigri TaxID=1285242 RepID=A0A178MJ21_9PROT|nr:dihydrofolate reductase family protein [Paramagnetospirillum marisnigri]OAN48004.1 dihydrofolate reductase [Paramagnetospirillum marisnigri]
MAGFRAYIAASLDGYITDRDGSIAWLQPFDAIDYGFDDFMTHIGTLVMGRTTYDHLHAMGHWPHGDKRCIVVTSRTMDTAPDNVEPWVGDIARLVEELRAGTTGDVWVAGGAKAIRAFLDLKAIDHFDLFVMPVMLGGGKPLFEPSERTARLTLLAAKSYINGVVRLSYVVG